MSEPVAGWSKPPLVARELVLTVGSVPLLMGILNVNHDSFSDPGSRTVSDLLTKAAALVEAGATLVDIGAQSAITGRAPADPSVEAARLVPVVTELHRTFPAVALSVDTYKPAVAEAVLAAGAHIVNDVSGLASPEVAEACARCGAALVVMHTAAPPLVRRQDPSLYTDVVGEVRAALASATERALALGVGEESLIVDPGVDFAKTPAQSVELLRGVDRIADLGYPLLLAISRKDFVGALVHRPPAGRDAGTLGAVAALRRVPRQILRVHDVAGTADAITVLDALTVGDLPDPGLALADHLRHQR